MKINITNTEKIREAIKKAEHRARTRTIVAEEIPYHIRKIEKRLHEMGIAQKNWKGIMFSCNPYAEPYANNYKGTPYGTGFNLHRGSGDWYITGIERITTNTSQKNQYNFSNEEEYRQYYNFTAYYTH